MSSSGEWTGRLGSELETSRQLVVAGGTASASVNGFLVHARSLRFRVDAVARFPLDAVRFTFDPHPTGSETTELGLRVTSGDRRLDVEVSGGSGGQSDDDPTVVSTWTFDLVVQFGCPTHQVEDVVIELDWAELDPPRSVLRLTAAELRQARRDTGDPA